MLDAAPLSFNLEFQPHGYNNTINIVVTYYGVMSNFNKEYHEKMHKSDYFDKVVGQCGYLNKIILEAETSQDLEQTVNLYRTARSETNDLTKSLRLFLSEVGLDDKLKAA